MSPIPLNRACIVADISESVEGVSVKSMSVSRVSGRVSER